MTKKDYELIASVIKQRIEMARLPNNAYYTSEECETVIQEQIFTANKFASILQEQNPKFDRERFLKACGVTS